MKRALISAVFGGLLVFGIPQVASASIHSATPADAAPAKDAGPKAGSDEGSNPQAQAPADGDHGSAGHKQDPPGEGRSHYDRKAHDDHNTF